MLNPIFGYNIKSMKDKRKIIFSLFIYLILFICSASLYASTDYTHILWDDYRTFRDAMYNSENEETLFSLQEKARSSAETLFTGADLFIAQSRLEYIMGRAYSYEGDSDKAALYYDKGEALAKKALDIKETAPALLMYAENISQNCSVKGVGYAISMGTKVQGLAKDVIKMEPKNGAALYMNSCQYIYAPSPFHNYKKGIKELLALYEDKSNVYEKDDLFNITSAIGYGYMQRKEYEDARVWFNKALEYYPGNKFVKGLLNDIRGK